MSELHGFDVQGGSGQVEDEQSTQNGDHRLKGGTISHKADNRDEQNTSYNTNRRQSTLTRQSGFHNESDSRHLVDQAAGFDLRTEDGNILVVVSNLDMEDQQEEIIDMEDGDIEIDCEENLEYSSVRLQQGHGSASSVHSDPDNADNCSVSVALSVSSLGSDNEEEVHDEDLINYPDESSKQKQRTAEVMDSQAQVRQLKLISECLCEQNSLSQYQQQQQHHDHDHHHFQYFHNYMVHKDWYKNYLLALIKYSMLSLNTLPLPSVWHPVYKCSS